MSGFCVPGTGVGTQAPKQKLRSPGKALAVLDGMLNFQGKDHKGVLSNSKPLSLIAVGNSFFCDSKKVRLLFCSCHHYG